MLSIIIPAYNDWTALDLCLRSLSEQAVESRFEVIVVDDGSRIHAPEFIRNWARCYPLQIVRQDHAGIPASRNRGIQASSGPVLLFVDADCRLQRDCLALLVATIAGRPQHNCFQMRLIGDLSTLGGRAEELRLTALQHHFLEPDGRIRYLNTAGFAIRRAKVNIDSGLFHAAALRAEDTLLLFNLMQGGELPFFVPRAVIQHAIPLTLIACLGKDIRSAYLERRAYEIVASQGFKIRVSNRERLKILAFMWRASRQRSIGRAAWFVLAARQGLQRGLPVPNAAGVRRD